MEGGRREDTLGRRERWKKGKKKRVARGLQLESGKFEKESQTGGGNDKVRSVKKEGLAGGSNTIL